MKITFLGTGTSIGVPEMGCTCAVCKSNNPKDKRLRTSLMIETEQTCILIDCSPDFREQVLRWGFRNIDGILITHEHYDHVGGIDDLRPFCVRGDLPIYAEQNVIEHLMQRLPYCFGPNKYPGTPRIFMNPISPENTLSINELQIIPIRVMHGNLPIIGFRIGNMAYITDMKSIEDKEFEKLQNLDVLIVNALHTKEHSTHQNVMQAVNFAQRVGAGNTYFVHMSHRVGLHDFVNTRLPASIELAYDCLVLSI